MASLLALTSVSLPVDASNEPSIALPSLPISATMLFPSDDHTGGAPPPPRGAVLSPPTPPPKSKSKVGVRLRGCALGARSITQRSGSVYERTGLLVEA